MTAVEAGADAVGLVFYPPSPRYVAAEAAVRIAQHLPPFVAKVGLFVDADREDIEKAVDVVGIDVIQFHGSESPDTCRGYRRPYIKAVRMRDGVDLAGARERYSDASALLLDAYRPGQPGGTGTTFDWDRIPPELAGEIILAGGLTAENVTDAVTRVRPYAVDVSGGVERLKGVKDPGKIKKFMRGVELGDEQNALG